MQPDPKPGPTRSGLASRPEGQRRAEQRAATYAGFTTAVPHIEAACRILRATARRGPHPLGRGATDVLLVMLHALPRRCWQTMPVLRLTNADLAAAAGLGVRSVQRHLAVLHSAGVIAICWGAGNSRLRFDDHADAQGEPVPPGIDLRPALVHAQTMAELAHAVTRAQHRFRGERRHVRAMVWQTRVALAGRIADLPPERGTAVLTELAGLQREIRQLSLQALGARADVAVIAAATDHLDPLADRARSLQAALERVWEDDDLGAASPDRAGDEPGEMTGAAASYDAKTGTLMTDSNVVDPVVPTIQERSECRIEPTPTSAATILPTPSSRHGQEDEDDDPVLPLLYARWLDTWQGTQPLASDDLVELEITARQLAHRLGVATRVINAAAERHGLMPVLGAILFVASRPASLRVRSPAGLLVSLLRREPGTLAPESFGCRLRPTAAPLSEAEALGLARRLAPDHQPSWVLQRWRATQTQRGAPITDPHRCLAGFARAIQTGQR